MKHWFILSFSLIFYSLTYAQSDYFKTDSTASFGIKLEDGGNNTNSRYCQVKSSDDITKYSPGEVTEFGFKDGRTYFAREVMLSQGVERVFLLRLVEGKNSLYFLKRKNRKQFFIEKDSNNLIPIVDAKNSCIFHQQLRDITTDCPQMAPLIDNLSYTSSSLILLVNSYNNCSTYKQKPNIKFRFGVTIGYDAYKLQPSNGRTTNYNQPFNFGYDGNLMVGLFIDQPINTSFFSLHSELLYTSHSFSYATSTESQELDFVSNVSTVTIPVMIRYAVPFMKLRPYANAGFSFAYNIKNESDLYASTIVDNIVEIKGKIATDLIAPLQMGIAVGAGFEYAITPKHSLFFELRYSNFNIVKQETELQSNTISLSTAYNF